MGRWHRKRTRNYDHEEKCLALRAYFSDRYNGMSLKEFSGICGINYYTILSWMQQIDWDESRIEELRRERKPRSTAALTELPAPVERLILEMKARFPEWGPLKIKQYLFRHEQVLIPTTRIYKLLKSKGLVHERDAVAKAETASRSFEYPYPLAAVQMDPMDLTLSSGTTIHLVSLMDDFSRFVLGCRFVAVKTMEEVIDAFKDAVRTYGVMERLLTDLGSEFVSWQNFTRFEGLLCDLEIEHIASGPQKPCNQGKVERWHQTVRAALRERGPLDYSSEAQLWIRELVDVYNYERPHEGIGGLVPADRFFGLKEELDLELERYRAGSRDGQRIYFACRVGDRKLVVSGPRADRLDVHLDGKRVQKDHPIRFEPLVNQGGAAKITVAGLSTASEDQLEEKSSAQSHPHMEAE